MLWNFVVAVWCPSTISVCAQADHYTLFSLNYSKKITSKCQLHNYHVITGAMTVRGEEVVEEEKRNQWTEMEIRGPIKNLSPELWKLTHLTALFLSDNNLQVCV